MLTCTLQDHASAIASEGRCLEPAYSANEVIFLKEENVVHPATMATPHGDDDDDEDTDLSER